MFCFCLQSSLLKLQALDVDGGTSLGPSPEDSPPPLGSKELKTPGVPAEPGGRTAAVCHRETTDENIPPELLMVLNRPPQPPRHQPLTAIHPDQLPPVPDMLSPSPRLSPQRSSPGGEGGGGDGSEGVGGGAFLQLLAGLPSPLPSPRCASPSLRFNSDPDTAPSPPCSQQYILCRGLGDRTEGSEDEFPPSISFLTKQIQNLKRRVRRFEDQFEQDMKYKPSHNDKYSNPEMLRVMSELAKARKQLKELRLRQSVFESKEPEPSDVCRFGSGQIGSSDHKPSLEETVESLLRRLREKRRSLGLPDNMKEMTQAQMVLEKITLQKCLLYFESVHGRPGTKQEKNLVKPLYDRYQMIKRLLCVSPTICTIEEEDGSDEESPSSSLGPSPPPPPPPPPHRGTWSAASEEDSDRDSDPAFVSPIDEVKAVRQQAALTTANLHEASRSQLLECLRDTRAEKKIRRKVLKEFEEEFYRQTGRICQKEDRSPMKDEYQEYKQLKAKLRLLEVLLSKQDATKTL
ncbi:protein FAM13C [Austrofundulus limnaeus]|uniref:Protein FAM13C n=1 Tax=Austrofundulus limnaeus TaxID=52670 RepID=A0A2I4CFN2_AUSLI|nr:PREDICTED: protein FAM13C-like [Austrofundulus limnaeus]